jgi:hypothetical protein
MNWLEGLKKGHAQTGECTIAQVSVLGLSQRGHNVDDCNPDDSPCGVNPLPLAVDTTGSKPN